MSSAGPASLVTRTRGNKDGYLPPPYVRFATDGRRVRFGMSFGPSWHEAREGPLTNGRFNPAALISPYPPRT